MLGVAVQKLENLLSCRKEVLEVEVNKEFTNITAFIKKVPYRFLATASPSPNDYIELGTSSEALGYMGYTDMLTKFFTNNEDTIKPQNIGTKWILKGHAHTDFFKWVSSWSISMRKPSDLGFDDTLFLTFTVSTV